MRGRQTWQAGPGVRGERAKRADGPRGDEASARRYLQRETLAGGPAGENAHLWEPWWLAGLRSALACAEGMGREGREGARLGSERDWAACVGFGFGFLFLFPISYFKHYSNLIEFKFKFEFNPSTQTNKRDAPA